MQPLSENLLMVSGDSHAGIAPERLTDWVDPKFRAEIKEQIAFNEEVQQRFFKHAPAGTDRTLYDQRGVVENGVRAGLWDPAVHLAELEAEGFVATVIYPGGPHSLGPFFTNFTFPFPAEVRAAGCKAYNRFLAEFCSHAPGRLFGVAQTETWPDMDAEVAEIHWAKRAGLGAIALPRFPGIEPNQPELTDRVWDKVFAACVDNDMPVAVHVGHSRKQGGELEEFRKQAMNVTGHGGRGADTIAFDTGRRPLWQLIFAGVFDRFPDLRVSFAEQRIAWVGPTLAQLERLYDETDYAALNLPRPKLRPCEYWQRHCAVAEQMRPYEVSLRHQTGLHNTMFGTDFPHAEGSWPNTREWLRIAMAGLPENELRLLLGENAVRFYKLDRDMLARHAARVGLKVAEVMSGERVDPDLVEILDWRSSFLSEPRRYDAEQAGRVMKDDIARAAA